MEARSASVKAAQFITERAYGRASASDEDRASLERAAVKISHVTFPDLPNLGEIKAREQLKSTFGDAPFTDGEIVEQKTTPAEQFRGEQFDKA